MEHKLKGRAAADEGAFLKHLGAFQNDDHREFSTRSVLGEDIAFLLNDGGKGGEGSEGGGGGIAFETLVAAERRCLNGGTGCEGTGRFWYRDAGGLFPTCCCRAGA